MMYHPIDTYTTAVYSGLLLVGFPGRTSESPRS